MIQKQSRYRHPLMLGRAFGLRGVISISGWLFSLFLLTACAMGTESVRVEEIAEKPSDFTGAQVKVRGEVEETYGNRAFILDEGQTDGENLFVITNHPLTVTERLEGKTVEVTGTVQRFNRDEIEQDLEFELDREVTREISEGEPVVIAQAVTGGEEELEGMGGGRNLIDEPGLDDNEFMDPKNELFVPNTHEPGR